MFKASRPSSIGSAHGIEASRITVREKKSGRPGNTRKTENNPTTDETTDAGVTSPSQSSRDNVRSEGGKMTWAQVVATCKALEKAKFEQLIQAMVEEQAAAAEAAAAEAAAAEAAAAEAAKTTMSKNTPSYPEGLPGTTSTSTDKVPHAPLLRRAGLALKPAGPGMARGGWQGDMGA